MNIKYIYDNYEDLLDKEITVSAWVRNHRPQKEFGFMIINDGTYFKGLQIVYDNKLKDWEKITDINLNSAVTVSGKLVVSPKANQKFELRLSNLKLEGDSPFDYPLTPKNHSPEYLRTIAHLRPRANLFQAVFRIRSVASYAIHSYFQKRDYIYVHTPIITANDGEGAGEMFQVTTLDLDKINSKVDYDLDFFKKKVGLCVTGQLEGETFAMAFRNIYTFGPTFRAEHSNTKTHAAEFWMVEPEIAFCDMYGLMDIEEEFLKEVVSYVLDKCPLELEFLDKYKSPGLLDKLNNLINSSFVRLSYKDAIEELKNAKVKFSNNIEYGDDLFTEHEKYLTNKYKSPVFVYNWPRDIKAFYMKANDDDTVRGVDLLVPEAGEIMGGSEREADYQKLLDRMHELDMKIEPLDWYLDLRKYGGCYHSGFGVGFDRLIIYLTGVDNIRDVIPFPRTVGNCEF